MLDKVIDKLAAHLDGSSRLLLNLLMIPVAIFAAVVVGSLEPGETLYGTFGLKAVNSYLEIYFFSSLFWLMVVRLCMEHVDWSTWQRINAYVATFFVSMFCHLML